MPRKKVAKEKPKAVEPESIAPEPEPIVEPTAQEVEQRDWLPTQPHELRVIAAKAWDKVKGKDDAPFAECQPAFLQTLMAHAESVQATYSALEGDTCHARFEQEVLRLIGE